MTNYPAAHSMDTEWFAVDKNGHVAQFWSGEGGARPRPPFPSEDRAPILRNLEGVLCGYGQDFGARVLAELGLFSYRCFDQVANPYARVVEVAAPLTIEEVRKLHPETAALLDDAALPTTFAEADLLQPAEFVECDLWRDTSWWRSTDGRYVFPGDDRYKEDFTESELAERYQVFLRNTEESRNRGLAGNFDFYAAVESELAWAQESVAWFRAREAKREAEKADE